jgi:hypothetical protein
MDLPASVSRLFVMATASVPFAIVVVRDGADPGDALCVMNGGNRTAFAQLRDLEPGRYTVYVGSETAARAPYYLEASTRGSNELRRFAEPVPMIPPTEAWAQWELRASDGCDPSRVCVEAVLNVHGAAGKQMGGLAPFASAQCTLVNEPGHVAGIRCGNDARWLQPVAHHPRRWVLERRVDAEGCVGDASCSEQVIVDRLELPAGAVMADDRTGRVKWLAPRPGARRLLDSMGTQVPLMPFEPNTPSTPTMEITAEAGTAHIEVLEEGSGAGEGAREDLDAGE